MVLHKAATWMQPQDTDQTSSLTHPARTTIHHAAQHSRQQPCAPHALDYAHSAAPRGHADRPRTHWPRGTSNQGTRTNVKSHTPACRSTSRCLRSVRDWAASFSSTAVRALISAVWHWATLSATSCFKATTCCDSLSTSTSAHQHSHATHSPPKVYHLLKCTNTEVLRMW
jgi:hypothetical protein